MLGPWSRYVVGTAVCDLGSSGMHLELRFWTDSRRADMLATTSEVRRRVVAADPDCVTDTL